MMQDIKLGNEAGLDNNGGSGTEQKWINLNYQQTVFKH